MRELLPLPSGPLGDGFPHLDMDRQERKRGETSSSSPPRLSQDTRKPRKRGLDQQPSLVAVKGSAFNSDERRQGYWNLNRPPVCPATQIKMSAAGESGDKEMKSPSDDGSEEESSQDSSDDGRGSSGVGGARCCPLSDWVVGAGSTRTPQRQPQGSDNRTSFLESDLITPNSLLELFKSCRLQYEKTPLKIVRASRQYMYDETSTEYLDCVNSVAHVGHCHPAIVEALSYTLSAVATTSTCGWDIDHGNIRYPTKLKQMLPSCFDTFLFCNSGSEAVDLSIQLARLYTCGTDAVVVDNAFHGSLDSVCALSPKVSKEQVEWVHVIPMPDMYRGTYSGDDPMCVKQYITESREILDRAQGNGKKIACFIAEPMLTIPGCIVPPGAWLQEMYKMVREYGGLCIADEVQTGLGRIGSHFWSFEAQNVIPDIVIIGKPLGNGYPMAAVVTSRDIAAVLGDRVKEYQCSAAVDAVGCAVLDVVHQEQLMNSAANVGGFLKDQLLILKKKHEYVGDVRGKGLMLGIEIVWSKDSKKPSREIAEQIIYRMKEENIIMANEGDNRNILMLIPPMCFSQENAVTLVQKLDKALNAIPTINIERDTGLPLLSVRPGSGTRDVRIGVFQPQEEEDDDNISSQQETMDLEYAQHCYQDLD